MHYREILTGLLDKHPLADPEFVVAFIRHVAEYFADMEEVLRRTAEIDPAADAVLKLLVKADGGDPVAVGVRRILIREFGALHRALMAEAARLEEAKRN